MPEPGGPGGVQWKEHEYGNKYLLSTYANLALPAYFRVTSIEQLNLAEFTGE